jgi:hypothetical protein
MDMLEAVNTWLRRPDDEAVVPARERSIEIFGNKKTLDQLQGTGLFSSGRLSLALLRVTDPRSEPTR